MQPEPKRDAASSESRAPLGETIHLLERVRGGDRAAREELFALYSERLQWFLRGRLGQPHRRWLDTMDLVNGALERTLANLDRFEHRGIGSFWAFLRTIGLNELRSVWRKKEALKEAEDLSEVASPDRPAPIDRLVMAEQCEAFESALEPLEPRLRQALLLRIELGLDYAAIAEDCGFPTADAARVAIRRALTQVAARMAAS